MRELVQVVSLLNFICSQVARKAKRAEIFKRAEKFAKEYQDQERDEIRYESTANKTASSI